MWLASPHFYPSYGGAQNRYRSYIPGLQQRGLDVRVVTGTPMTDERHGADQDADWLSERPGTWLPATTLDGAPLERIRLPDSKSRKRTRIYHDALLEVCGRPAEGAVVAQLLTNLRPAARPWLRRLRSAGVATLYSLSQYPKWPQRPFKRIFRQPAYRRVFNEFDALVTNSEAIADFLRDIGVRQRIEYIPNGVDLGRFRPVSSPGELAQRLKIRSALGIEEGHTAVICVGAVMPRKGQALVIEAWQRVLAQHPDSHLLFVGPRADQHDAKLHAYGERVAAAIEASGAPGRVHFTDLVEDVENYLRAADLFVLASSREGTPNSVLEAMATGLPCLVSPYTGLSQGIGQAGRDYVLVEREPAAIAAALGPLLGDSLARADLGQRGRRFVQAHADQRHSLDRYATLYRELGAGARARRGG